MNRYYSSNQVLSGLGGLISDAVNMRHQVKAQEAALHDRATMQTYGGLGQGVGNIASSYADTSLGLHRQNLHHAQQLALQQAQTQRYQNIEDQRSANDIYEQSLKTWDAIQYGGGKNAAMQSPMMAPMADMGGGQLADGQMGPPAPPAQGTVPMPSIDPGTTAAYRDAEIKRDELIQQGQRIQLSNLPAGEKAAALREITPQLFEATRMLRTYQRPQPTMRDMVQQQTWTDPNTGMVYHPKEIAVSNGPKTNNAENLLSWAKVPDPVIREQGKQQFIRDSFAGDYDAFVAKGGFGEIDMTTGKVNFTEPKESKADDDEKPLTYKEARAQAFKELTKTVTDKDNNKTIKYPSEAETNRHTNNLLYESNRRNPNKRTLEDIGPPDPNVRLRQIKAQYPDLNAPGVPEDIKAEVQQLIGA